MTDLRLRMNFPAVLVALAVLATPASAFDIGDFVARRCIDTFLAGARPDNRGLTKLGPAEAQAFLADYGRGTVYAGAEGGIENPILVVPASDRDEICAVTYKGPDRKAFGRVIDALARRPGADELQGIGGWDGETDARAVRFKRSGREILVLGTSYPFLKSTSFFVLRPGALDARESE